MKKLYFAPLILILFIINGCTNSSDKPIGLYALNMLYSCECPRYRVFRIDNIDEKTPKLKDRIQSINIESAIDSEISKEMDFAINITDSGSALIGRDLELAFKNSELEKLFNEQEGLYPICYIYYLEGTLEDKQTFMVEKFKLIPKTPNCI